MTLDSIIYENKGSITKVAAASMTAVGAIAYYYNFTDSIIPIVYITLGSSTLIYYSIKYMIKRKRDEK